MSSVQRAAVVLLAAAAVWLAADILPQARQIDSARMLTGNLLNRQDYPIERVMNARATVRQAMPANPCMADGEDADLIMTAWLADHNWIQMRPPQLDELQSDARRIAALAMQCNPLQPLGWLVYARFRMLTHGVDDDGLNAVRHTYRIAPFEGWAMRLRAGMLIGLRKSLTAQDRAWLMNDLRGLVASEAQHDVVDLLSRTEREFQQDVASAVAALPYEIQRRYQSAALQVGVDVTRLSIPPSWSEPTR